MDTGHWLINEGVNITEHTFGFIYEITNIVTNKKYIGKKQCTSRVKRKPLKGKVKNRIDYKESDWKSYTSSSNELNEDIKKYGKENFNFKILKSCNSKWELAYFEIKEQLDNNVLLRDDYYNGIINVRIGRPPKNFKINKE
jgi:Putative endonuclease segE, GIY-YIG domain